MIYLLFLISYLLVAYLKFRKNKVFYMNNKALALTALLVDIACWMFLAYIISAFIQ